MITIKFQEAQGEVTVTLSDEHSHDPQAAANSVKEFFRHLNEGQKAD